MPRGHVAEQLSDTGTHYRTYCNTGIGVGMNKRFTAIVQKDPRETGDCDLTNPGSRTSTNTRMRAQCPW